MVGNGGESVSRHLNGRGAGCLWAEIHDFDFNGLMLTWPIGPTQASQFVDGNWSCLFPQHPVAAKVENSKCHGETHKLISYLKSLQTLMQCNLLTNV